MGLLNHRTRFLVDIKIEKTERINLSAQSGAIPVPLRKKPSHWALKARARLPRARPRHLRAPIGHAHRYKWITARLLHKFADLSYAPKP